MPSQNWLLHLPAQSPFVRGRVERGGSLSSPARFVQIIKKLIRLLLVGSKQAVTQNSPSALGVLCLTGCWQKAW